MISEITENKSKITSLELIHNSIGIECAKKLSSAINLIENYLQLIIEIYLLAG